MHCHVKRVDNTTTCYLQQTFHSQSKLSNVIRRMKASAVCKMTLCLDAGTKTGATLLHCSINDTSINRVPHFQNTFIKLINVLGPMFVQVIIICTKVCSGFLAEKKYHYYHFGYMQQSPLGIFMALGTVVTFYRCSRQIYNRSYMILS